MIETIDLGPLEPAWVRETPPSGIIEWTVTRLEWNKELKRNKQRTEYHRGEPLDFLHSLCQMSRASNFCPTEIKVDASQSTGEPIDKCYRDFHHCGLGWLFWIFKSETNSEERGSDFYELIEWVNWAIENCYSFEIELDIVDPTPEYTEIGSFY